MEKSKNAGKFIVLDIPDGFELLQGLDDRKPYIVPKFMVPAVEHAVNTNGLKEDNRISHEQCTQPFTKESMPCVTLAGLLHMPPEPPLTNMERLALHSEVCALQAGLRISYKDAMHRLYMAELEKLKVADTVVKYNAHFNRRINESLEGLGRKHNVYPKSK